MQLQAGWLLWLQMLSKAVWCHLFREQKLTGSKMLQLLPQIPEYLVVALPLCSARCFLPLLSWLGCTGHIAGRSCFRHSGLGPSVAASLCRRAENWGCSGC